MVAYDVLTSLDKAKTQWYHFTAIIIAGMGFFTDAYDLFCISTVTRLIGRIYYYHPPTKTPGTIPAGVNSALNGVALVGALVGQLLFGYLGDKLGRKRVYGLTLLMMIVFSFASACSFGTTAKAVLTSLCFFRFWLGVGIGGDYPLSATIMSEYANSKTRGAFIASVFAMQGTGLLFAGLVALSGAAIFNHLYPAPPFSVNQLASQPPQADFLWRFIFAIGAIPAILTFYYRLKMPETARYTALVEHNSKQAAADMARVLQVEEVKFQVDEPRVVEPEKQFGLFSWEFARKHGLHLLGTTSCWFFLDVSFYSQNLFQKDVYTAVGWLPAAATMSAVEEVFKVAKAQTLIALFSTVPGYWVTVALIDIIGRWIIQLQGFFFMAVFMLALSIPYNHLKADNHVGFVILYALTFFFSNFGPNSTTFVVPAEVFPARFRSTCHGISAAAGKAGAIVGAFGFLYASQPTQKSLVPVGYNPGIGLRTTLIILGCINICGFMCTFLVPETNQKSLEDITGENKEEEELEVARGTNNGAIGAKV